MTGDFVQDVTEMANRIDRRLRLSLTPQQYAMVQDLVLATRITTIARDAAEELRRVDGRLRRVRLQHSPSFLGHGLQAAARSSKRSGARLAPRDRETMFQTITYPWHDIESEARPARYPDVGDDVMSSNASPTPGPRILVVDDEDAILDFVELGLRYEGFEVELARDGLEALAAVASRRPDLILLDLNLPGLDGLDVCRRVRQASDVPIIMLTARGDVDERVEGLEAGRGRLSAQAVQVQGAAGAGAGGPATPDLGGRARPEVRRAWS